MKRPVFSFRPNLKNPDHRKAWERLMAVPEGEKTAYLVNAILSYEHSSRLEAMIRQVIREELKGKYLTEKDSPQEARKETDEIPEQMLEFLSRMDGL